MYFLSNFKCWLLWLSFLPLFSGLLWNYTTANATRLLFFSVSVCIVAPKYLKVLEKVAETCWNAYFLLCSCQLIVFDLDWDWEHLLYIRRDYLVMPSDRGRTKEKVPYQPFAYQILVIVSSDPMMGATLVCVWPIFKQIFFLTLTQNWS